MLGHHTARALRVHGHELVVIHRPGSKLDKLAQLEFEAREADLDDRPALERAFKSLNAVVNCAAYYPTVPRPWREEVRTGLAQMENFYNACETADLQKIVYLGGAIALKKHPEGKVGDESLEYAERPADKNPYLQVKWAMHRLAIEKARAGLPVSIGIPTMTLGDFDYGPSTGAFIVETANRTLPGYVDGRRNIIYAGDAGRGLALVCEKGRPGESYLLTGENMRLGELIEIIARTAGVPAPKKFPLPLVRLLGAFQELRYKLNLGPVPKISRTAIAVMASGQFLSGAKAAEDLGFEAQVSVAEAVERALVWFKEVGYVTG